MGGNLSKSDRLEIFFLPQRVNVWTVRGDMKIVHKIRSERF